jgi:hypothetical protein
MQEGLDPSWFLRAPFSIRLFSPSTLGRVKELILLPSIIAINIDVSPIIT